mmetsp:Transcript_1679/g.1511  ORF Transcript_1679/g.1511 Transcript_1679/m.1511 type:complete len:139 (+) Transcript_1679:113-529(+)
MNNQAAFDLNRARSENVTCSPHSRVFCPAPVKSISRLSSSILSEFADVDAFGDVDVPQRAHSMVTPSASLSPLRRSFHSGADENDMLENYKNPFYDDSSDDENLSSELPMRTSKPIVADGLFESKTGGKKITIKLNQE